MLSQTAEYALRAVVFLGEQYGSPCTTREIAEATQVPNGYLSKVLQALNRGGLVRSQRGLHGGFQLRSSPADVSLLDVLEVVEPLRRVRSCPLGLPEHAERLCPLHQRLDDAVAMLERCFRTTSVADLIVDGQQLNPLYSRDRERCCGGWGPGQEASGDRGHEAGEANSAGRQGEGAREDK